MTESGLGGIVKPYKQKSVNDLVSGWLGIEPVQHRSSMLPLVKNMDGSVGFGYPQMAIDAIEAMALPGHVAKGGVYTPQDVAEMAIDVGMMAAPVGYATAPMGAVAMGAGGKAIPKKVKNKNFDNWFGGSKVVDEAGQPLTVYHGTASDVSSFNPKISGNKSKTGAHQTDLFDGMFFFSDAPDVASSYTAKHGSMTGNPADDIFLQGGNVIPAKLKMENPLIYHAKGDAWDDVYNARLIDGFEDVSTINDLAARAKELGYDGVIAKGIYDKGIGNVDNVRADTHIVFNPSQIKSTHNRGTYDPTDPNILNMNSGLGSLLGLLREREQ